MDFLNFGNKKIENLEEQTNIDKTIEDIYSIISDIDGNGHSRLTTKIKNVIERSLDDRGNINPTRVNQLIKLARSAYSDFLILEKNRQEKEVDKEQKNHFIIPFEGNGYDSINHLVFNRLEKKTWRTSEYGSGYTTTASYKPDWLTITKNEDSQTESTYVDGPYGPSDGMFFTSQKYNGSVMGIRCEIESTWRRHENGECGDFTFYFEDEFHADLFSEKLGSQLSASSKEKRFEEFKGNIKELSTLAFIDEKKYAIFHIDYLTRKTASKNFMDKNYESIYGNMTDGKYDHAMDDLDQISRYSYPKKYKEDLDRLLQDKLKNIGREEKIKDRSEFNTYNEYREYIREIDRYENRLKLSQLTYEDIEALVKDFEEYAIKELKEKRYFRIKKNQDLREYYEKLKNEGKVSIGYFKKATESNNNEKFWEYFEDAPTKKNRYVCEDKLARVWLDKNNNNECYFEIIGEPIEDPLLDFATINCKIICRMENEDDL